jgi:hypothetical protein
MSTSETVPTVLLCLHTKDIKVIMSMRIILMHIMVKSMLAILMGATTWAPLQTLK